MSRLLVQAQQRHANSKMVGSFSTFKTHNSSDKPCPTNLVSSLQGFAEVSIALLIVLLSESMSKLLLEGVEQ